jgi:hypothetical protein
MDVVTLPVLSIEALLEDALATMKDKGRSAVVARDQQRYWLFKAGWVAVERSRGEKILADVERRWRVHEASKVEVAERNLNLVSPHDTYSAVEEFLDHVGRAYMLAAPVDKAGDVIAIITRHEGYTVEVSSGPTGYYCTNPNRQDDPHPYLPPPLPADLKCTKDGSPIVPAF